MISRNELSITLSTLWWNQLAADDIIIIIIIIIWSPLCKPGESVNTISPKTPTPHNQPMEGRKR